MNDILPPKRPLNKDAAAQPSLRPVQPENKVYQPSAIPTLEAQVANNAAKPKVLVTKPRKMKKIIFWVLGAIIFCILGAAASLYIWYTQSLQPINVNDQSRIHIEIPIGSSPSDIAEQLENKKLIKSKQAFDIYTRLTATRSRLQAGTYSLSPSESTEAIVAHLVGGRVDQLTITFLPGATLADNRKVFIDAGFTEAEVDAALDKQYDHLLFKDKPADTDLEGYIWGETYTFGRGASVEDILVTTFDHYYEVITENKLEEAYEQRNLTLYQAITLASIVQREVPSEADQKQVAQVFFERLETDMQLGSDVTYQYAAKKMGVEPTPELDSLYNTRRYSGLPPGPIATPGKSALQAVAHPASGDYLYFLSGDDDVTYFAHTFEEHESNIRQHCQQKCAVF